MIDIAAHLSDNQSEVDLTLPTMATPLKLTTAGVEDFIRALSRLRMQMSPAVPLNIVDNETPVNADGAIRWQIKDDPEIPRCVRLHLLHPGFGWIWASLSEAQAEELTDSLQTVLQNQSLRRPLQ